MRGRPREYENRYPLTVSVEKDLWDYAQRYDILARDAMSYGLQGLIESEIIKTKKASPDEIDRYLSIKNRELQYIVSIRDRETKTIDEISNIRDEIKKNRIEEPSESDTVLNWNRVPEDQRVRIYIQQIFTKDERAQWISRYLSADDDFVSNILKLFCEEFITRFKNDPNKPFRKVDAGEVKRVLLSWAEAEGGV